MFKTVSVFVLESILHTTGWLTGEKYEGTYYMGRVPISLMKVYFHISKASLEN